jgi:RimJ/RimL family protein N-acetyltransferase
MSQRVMPEPRPTWGDVVLRPFADSDVDMLMELATDPYLPLIGSLPANATRRAAEEFIARQRQRLPMGAGYSFCVADRRDERTALGTAGLWIAELEHGRASAGYSVAPSARGRGVASSALRALTEFGWTLPELFRIELYIEPWNTGSIRVAEAVGYEREGLLRSHQPIGDRRADMLLFATLRSATGPVAPGDTR